MNTWCGIEGPFTALVVGARGGVGEAFVECLARSPAVTKIIASSRDPQWVADHPRRHKVTRHQADITDENSLIALSQFIGEQDNPLRFAINCSGLLHHEELQPERTWRHLNIDTMRRVFDVNALGVALYLKHFLPLVPRRGRSIVATLSARIGSITDNRIGGWYSYRASKAAQNMIVKTAAIEAVRKYPELAVVALHPGTVQTPLSNPFTKRLPANHKLFTPTESCAHLCSTLQAINASGSGGHYAWDGSAIPG